MRLDKLGLFLVLKKKVDSGKLRLRGSVASFLRERERERKEWHVVAPSFSNLGKGETCESKKWPSTNGEPSVLCGSTSPGLEVRLMCSTDYGSDKTV